MNEHWPSIWAVYDWWRFTKDLYFFHVYGRISFSPATIYHGAYRHFRNRGLLFRRDFQIYSFHVLLEYLFNIYIFWCAKNEPLSWFSNFIHLVLKQRTPLSWMLTNGSIHVFWTYHSSQVLINEWLTFKVCSKIFHEISLLYISDFMLPKLLQSISR